MTKAINSNRINVQQAEGLAGQVNGQALAVQDIVGEAVNQPTAEEREHERLRKILRETRIRTDTEVPPEEYSLQVDDKGIFALRDIHAVKAKQKAGKTTALKVIMAALLLGEKFRLKSLLEKPKILFFDTEQSRTDTKRIILDVMQMTGLDPDYVNDRVVLQSLRRCEQDDLLPMLHQAIEDEKPQVVFIDGIVEFVASFNDEALAKTLIKDLLVLCDEHNCAIVCVLHTNKAEEDHNMRGHLGTMLAQKAATVLECSKERGSRVITVSCSEARHEEPSDWSIAFDQDGHIVDADELHRQLQEQRKAEQLQRRQETLEKEKKARLEQCLRIIRDKGGFVSRKQLTEILVKVLERKRPTVATYISEWLKDNAVVEIDGMIQDPNNMLLNL
ncbi:MAG: AAA family ATPase [Alloprevotella sp.]|nr:AAA family ATPase [Alloprevotella sp.]